MRFGLFAVGFAAARVAAAVLASHVARLPVPEFAVVLG